MKEVIKPICHACGGANLSKFDSFHSLTRVTSDCKSWPINGNLAICLDCCLVQKVIDAKWRAEIQQIYAHYELYNQATDNREQPIFNSTNGTHSPRSRAIIKFIRQAIPLKENIKAIDIGCGVGNMLISMSEALPHSELFGFEPNTNNVQALQAIKNVQEIYIDKNQYRNQKFDLITLIHVLEHIDHPVEVLKKLTNNLNEQGHLVIAVPNYKINPFDLVIADHASHFSIDTLSSLLNKCGFEIVLISDSIINKELIAICRRLTRDTGQKLADPVNNQALVTYCLDWLHNSANAARELAKTNRPFGIFGTSIAANWLFGELKGEVDFFADEDLDRVDKLYHNKPVYHASMIPANSHTYICLQPSVIKSILSRLGSEKFNLYPTPSFDFELEIVC